MLYVVFSANFYQGLCIVLFYTFDTQEIVFLIDKWILLSCACFNLAFVSAPVVLVQVTFLLLQECNFDHAMFSPNTANVDPTGNDAGMLRVLKVNCSLQIP